MGFELSQKGFDVVLHTLSKDYAIYAPKRISDGGRFSDTDCIRYGEIQSAEEIVFDKKSEYSFKEVLIPVSETLFYFTEDTVTESNPPKRGAIIFLRSCDLHAVKRLDEMYLKNGNEDYYYNRIRKNIKFVLMGCASSFENCFCVDMGTNQSDQYDMSIDEKQGIYKVDCKLEEWTALLKENANNQIDVTPEYVKENKVKVNIPANLSYKIAYSKLWKEYDQRCINCGRCNFVCPTCTCFSMQDLYYSENGKSGERRRVWASCMVDGYTDVAGGGNYRQKNGQRMRFKVLHKVLDFKERSGYHMCVGCGRCDDICPEYISFSNCINKLEKGMEEVLNHDA
jgi:anaerobic sulfite reductase subunit A